MFGWKIAVLALGSNLGDRGETLHSAIEQLGAHPKIRVLEKSPLVESIALTESGLDESKPNYLNGVVKIATKLSPRKLLAATSEIELSSSSRAVGHSWGYCTVALVRPTTQVMAYAVTTCRHYRISPRRRM